jgi:hypothetical protein
VHATVQFVAHASSLASPASAAQSSYVIGEPPSMQPPPLSKTTRPSFEVPSVPASELLVVPQPAAKKAASRRTK